MSAAEGTGGQAVGTVDDAEPLNDAEAEAVLLMLGPRLEWWGHPFKNTATVGEDEYFVAWTEHDGGYWEALDWYEDENRKPYTCPFEYRTIAEAKTACERHHTTGKWE